MPSFISSSVTVSDGSRRMTLSPAETVSSFSAVAAFMTSPAGILVLEAHTREQALAAHLLDHVGHARP